MFIVAIAFDIVGVLFPLEKPVFKFLAIPASRSNFFDVGWYNMLAAAVITFFTVAAGFYEIMLAEPPGDIKSAWGLQPTRTLPWSGTLVGRAIADPAALRQTIAEGGGTRIFETGVQYRVFPLTHRKFSNQN